MLKVELVSTGHLELASRRSEALRILVQNHDITPDEFFEGKESLRRLLVTTFQGSAPVDESGDVNGNRA